MNSTSRTRKLTSLGFVTAAIFAFSTVAPNQIAPDILSADHAFAAKGGNGKGNSGDKSSGNNGSNKGNSGNSQAGNKGNKSTSFSGSGFSRGNGQGKKTGGGLLGKLFGWEKEKPNKGPRTEKASIAKQAKQVKQVKEKGLHPVLGEFGIHPKEAKGFNALFHANYNAWAHAGFNNTSSKFARGLDWLGKSHMAVLANQTYQDALANSAVMALIEEHNLDPLSDDVAIANLANDQIDALQADYDRLSAALAEYDAAVAALGDELALTNIDQATYDANLATLNADFETANGTTVEAAQTDVIEPYEAWDSVLSSQAAAQETQQASEDAFHNVTPNVEYTTDREDAFKQAIYDDPEVAAVVDGYIAEMELAAAEAAAAEAELVAAESLLLEGSTPVQ